MNESVKKFKNGKIKLSGKDIDDSFYHDDMFMNDLYINQINGYMYIVDFNTSLVYEIGSYLLQNPIKYIIDTVNEDGKMYLYPLTKSECKSLLEDLENGY